MTVDDGCDAISVSGARCILKAGHSAAHAWEPDQLRGMYPKYRVSKIIHGTDQRGDPTETLLPVEGSYFVLRYDKDPHARFALAAYAQSCHKDYPRLSADLQDELNRVEDAGNW